MQPAFVIIDENTGSDVHGIDQTQPFFHTAFLDKVFDFRGYVDEFSSTFCLEKEMLGERFHGFLLKLIPIPPPPRAIRISP